MGMLFVFIVGLAIIAILIAVMKKVSIQAKQNRTSDVQTEEQSIGKEKDITKMLDVQYVKRPLLTQTERQFLSILYQALSGSGYGVLPQVATNAILNIEPKKPGSKTYRSHSQTIRNKFEKTHIDFTICDQQLNVILLIELDDHTHDSKKDSDRERDFITNQAGYRTLRFDCRQMPTVEQVRQSILG